MSVFNALNTSLYEVLQASTALTGLLAGTTSIYHKQAPDGVELDYIVFNVQGGGDENLTPNRTKNLVCFVRGFSGSGAAKAGSIDAQIDVVLHGQTLTVAGWTNFWLARETDLEAVEVTKSGEKIDMAGGFYRIKLDKN